MPIAPQDTRSIDERVSAERKRLVERCLQAAISGAVGGDDARKVYAITAPEVGRVKFGYSSDPARRFHGIKVASPVSVSLVAVVEGGPRLEELIHNEFRDTRRTGEWFDLDDDADELICAMRQGLEAVAEFFINRIQ